jgi:ABC-type Fe3+ transport system permease subunit
VLKFLLALPARNEMTILVISTIVHYYTVPFLTATTALKQIDPEFESISESLNAPFYKTFLRVIVPVSLPAIISIASYLFLNAMVTLSVVVFLFTPGDEIIIRLFQYYEDSSLNSPRIVK